MSQSPSQLEPEVDLGAAILAWVLPGMGHIRRGYVRRGRLIMLGVLGLFVAGVLIGGVDCVDRKEDRLWFIAQALCGPVAFITDVANQTLTKTLPARWEAVYANTSPQDPSHQAIVEKLKMRSLGRVNEMGTLFCALAGLMNLVAILDALYYVPKQPPPTVERRKAATP